ncbi:hypothetical protein WJX82_002529 [Trebouxia sp. C0006]
MPASSPQVHLAADSLYYRQYAFLKLPPYEVQQFADIKDILSSDEPVLERQGLQQFPQRIVRHFNPEEHQGFLSVSLQSAWFEVVGLLEGASVDILDAIAMSTHLGLTPGAFRGIVDTPSQTLSSSSLDVIQYLPVAETISSLKPEGGCALHHDRGLLTLIWSDTVEGLQVVNTKTGLFEDVLVPEGYILVLPGYTLQRATCGIYKAAAHRVTMRDVEGERLAVTFKLRSPDTALLDFHSALTAAGKQVEPRFAGPIRVIELLAMFDEMHPSINDASSKEKDKVLIARQAAITDPAYRSMLDFVIP